MATVNVYYARSNIRSVHVAQAAALGLKRSGERVKLIECQDYKKVDSDYAVMYGFADRLREIYEDYRSDAAVVYFDLGYWKRRIKTRYDGYYKAVVNGRHPTEYFQKREHCGSRLEALGVEIQPWRSGGENVILAGMSEKAARAEGLEHQRWERDAFKTLVRHTNRPIIYRPKPNCSRSRPIKGARFDKTSLPGQLFETAHAIVTRHSNIAVEGLIAGIPAFCDAGVASVLSKKNLVKIEKPWYPDNRLQWARDIAWCQFKLTEIKDGLPFKHLKEEGLIP